MNSLVSWSLPNAGMVKAPLRDSARPGVPRELSQPARRAFAVPLSCLPSLTETARRLLPALLGLGFAAQTRGVRTVRPTGPEPPEQPAPGGCSGGLLLCAKQKRKPASSSSSPALLLVLLPFKMPRVGEWVLWALTPGGTPARLPMNRQTRAGHSAESAGLSFGRAGVAAGRPSLGHAGLSGAPAALGAGGGDVPPCTHPSPIPTRSQNSRNPPQNPDDLRVETLLLNRVFLARVVTAFLLLVLKVEIYPLLILVLF